MSLKDGQIALLEARMSSEMANLIHRHGGIARSVPAVRETALDCGLEVAAFIERLVQGEIGTVVFFTGVGVNELVKEAERLERSGELLAVLNMVTIVCRGPKPSAALKRLGVGVTVGAREPYTTAELLESLATLELAGTAVGVVHYGERNELLAQELRERGAELVELVLYEWRLPEDVSALEELVRDIIAGRVEAVVFTSQIQARHLFLIAEKLRETDALKEALNTKATVASIGPTCTAVLHTYGVTPHVIPEHPKMGHLVKALVDYLA